MNWIEANGASLRYDLSGSAPRPSADPRGRRLHRELDDALPASSASSASAVRPAGLRDVGEDTGHLDGRHRGRSGGAARRAADRRPVHLRVRDEPRSRSRSPDATRRASAGSRSPAPRPGPTPTRPRPQAHRGNRARRRACGGAGEPERSYPENMRLSTGARFERFRRRWLGNDPEAMAAILRMSTNPAFDLSQDLARSALHPGDRLHSRRDSTPAMVVRCPQIRREVRRGKLGPLHGVETPDLFIDLALPFLRRHSGRAEGRYVRV